MDTQEEVSKQAIKLMMKVPKLSGDLVVAALRYLLKKLKDREPVGNQSLAKLMARGYDVKRTELTGDADMKLLARMARKNQVGLNIAKNQDGTYSVYFRARRADQVNQCLKDYAQMKLTRQGREPVSVKLQRAKTIAAARAEEQPDRQTHDRQRERTVQRERGAR